MMETSKIETLDAAEKTMAVIHSRIEKTRIKETMTPIDLIDSGSFDDHILPHGIWPSSREDPVEETAMEIE
jgi:hypothetical protein